MVEASRLLLQDINFCLGKPAYCAKWGRVCNQRGYPIKFISIYWIWGVFFINIPDIKQYHVNVSPSRLTWDMQWLYYQKQPDLEGENPRRTVYRRMDDQRKLRKRKYEKFSVIVMRWSYLNIVLSWDIISKSSKSRTISTKTYQ